MSEDSPVFRFAPSRHKDRREPDLDETFTLLFENSVLTNWMCSSVMIGVSGLFSIIIFSSYRTAALSK